MNPIITFFLKEGKDIIEQPLQILDHHLAACDARKDKEHEQKLLQKQQAFEAELEAKKRKMNMELDKAVSDAEDEKNRKFMELVREYQMTMAECSDSIGKSLGMMSFELQEKAENLKIEKVKAYRQIQHEAELSAMEKFELVTEKFKEGSFARNSMEKAIEMQMNGIIQNCNTFMKDMAEDFRKLVDNINDITKQANMNANAYLAPAAARIAGTQILSANQPNGLLQQ